MPHVDRSTPILGPRPRRRVVGAAAALAVVALLAGCASSGGAASPGAGYVAGDGTVTELALDDRPDPISFSGPTDDSGDISSDDLLGEVVVVNFWYAACPPCRTEAPWLEELSQEFADDGVQFVGVNVRDDAPTSRSFAERFGVTYPSIVDTDGSATLAFAGQVSPTAVPTTIVLDRQGRPASRIVGLIDRGVLRALIDTAVAEEG